MLDEMHEIWKNYSVETNPQYFDKKSLRGFREYDKLDEANPKSSKMSHTVRRWMNYQSCNSNVF